MVLFNHDVERPDPNFSYLTGLVGLFEQNFLIVKKKSLVLITNKLEYENVKEHKFSGMEIASPKTGKEIATLLQRHCKRKVVGIYGVSLPYFWYMTIKRISKAKSVIDATSDFYRARQIKDEDEIENIRIANRIVKSALKEIPRDFKEGMTEKDLAARFDYIMMKHGANEPAFASIVQFGKNSALPHHLPDDTRLTPNSIVLLDVGARYKNYCSDVTRTFVFKPDKSSDKYKKILEIQKAVKGSQQAALKVARDGVHGRDIQAAAADYIASYAKGKYKEYAFPSFHELGHAVGIELHEGFVVSTKTDTIMREGMVVSDEPGIYIVGFGGIRLEDDILITKTGAKIL
ncbi:MAG: M24 family metallopeptidase [Candidatus Micrarchaeota archaeon]|nr:M24 family metallopeptidase [Candidatus Micrarchaeota archaeon]